MSLATFKIGKQEFVILPRRRYEQLTRAERDRKDAEIAQKANELYLTGKVKGVPLDEVRRKWGL